MGELWPVQIICVAKFDNHAGDARARGIAAVQSIKRWQKFIGQRRGFVRIKLHQGGMDVSTEDAMPSFEIYYRDSDGTLVEKLSVQCATPMKAKVMAHAMRAHPFAEIEVWQGDALVYERPERIEAAPAHIM
jgi:hypothetical protein